MRRKPDGNYAESVRCPARRCCCRYYCDVREAVRRDRQAVG